MSGTRKKPQRPQPKILSNVLSRFSRKIVPMENDRGDEYRKRANIAIKQKPKPKTKSHSPEPTKANWINTVGTYVSEEASTIIPTGRIINMNNEFNHELPNAYEYLTDIEYPPKKETFIDRMMKKIRRPKIEPTRRPEYSRIQKNGGKTRRKKNLRKRGKGGTCSSSR